MKVILHSVHLACLALTGCQSPSGDLPAAARASAPGVEFKRSARVYEEGDALFAVINTSPRVLWFQGQGPELPAYRLKVGASIGPEQNPPILAHDGTLERFPLAPGHSCYFHINSTGTSQPASVGVMFYEGRTATDGFMMWSPPVSLPARR